VDVSKFGEARPEKRGGVILGWIGQAATLPYLEDILPALDELETSIPGLSLRVISDAFPAPKTIRLDPRPWSEGEEAGLLAGIDVGLMPLRDDPWARGKCGYKILQYFAARKPVIASPVGVNADLVRPGSTGFLASNPSEWMESVTVLAKDSAMRDAFGGKGFETLEEGGFTLEAYAVHLAAFLRQIA
jgi:glycosyltransferase involved in cell wall biosynthesis